MLSFLGSSAIIYIILSARKRKLTKPKNRFMLMMSVFDVLQSVAIVVSTAAFPQDLGIYGAIGNEATCTAQSVLMGLGLAVPLYNSSLNLFYLMTIRYNMTAAQFSTKLEPFLHAFSVLVPLSSAAICAALGYANPSITTCLYPGQKLPTVGFAVTVIFSFLFCVFSMGSICWAVMSQANRIQRHRYGTTQTNRGSILEKEEMVAQALAYSLAFLLTFLFPTIHALVISGQPETPTPALDTLSSIFYPLQGFYNFVFYVRPGVNHVREIDPSKSLFKAIQEVIINAESVSDSFRNIRSTNRLPIQKRKSIAVNTDEKITRNPSYAISMKLSETDNDLENACHTCDKPTRRVSFINCDHKSVQQDNSHLEMIYTQPQIVTQTAFEHNEPVSDITVLPIMAASDVKEGFSLNTPDSKLYSTIPSSIGDNGIIYSSDKTISRKVDVSDALSLPISALLTDYKRSRLRSESKLQTSVRNISEDYIEDNINQHDISNRLPSISARRRASLVSFASVLSVTSLDSLDNEMINEPMSPISICNMNELFNEGKEIVHNTTNKSASKAGRRRASLRSIASALSGISFDSLDNDSTALSGVSLDSLGNDMTGVS